MSDDHANVAFFPPLGFAVALVCVTALGWLLPVPASDTVASILRGSGIALIALAGALGVLAILRFRAADTHVEPYKPTTALVTGGVYRVTRNPMYLGLLGMTLGIGFWFANLWAIPGAAALWLALDRGVVAREERYLEAKFGEPYRAFLQSTRRWL